jgi:hypothetical protein
MCDWDDDGFFDDLLERELDEVLRELGSYDTWAYYQGEDYDYIRPEDYDLYELYTERMRARLPEGTNKVVRSRDAVEDWEREKLLYEMWVAADEDDW